MNRAGHILRFLLKMVGFFVLYQLVLRLVRKRFPFPVPPVVGRFLDSDLRRWMQPPGPIMERSEITEGKQVLEIGCGSGAYTLFAARAVGAGGEVCALDIQAAMLEQLARKLEQPAYRDIGNIRLYRQSAYALPFEDQTFDVVYMITVLPEIPDRQRALLQVKRVLKPDGVLAVTEFLVDPDYPLRSTTVRLGRDAGFELDAVLGNLWTYTVRFRK
jgi:SAM-dependent methyltransferase